MRRMLAAVGAGILVLSSCGTTNIDDYYYGYPQAYREMPKEFERVEVAGMAYWQHGGRYYKYDGERGYLLVKPPRGHEQVAAAGGATAPPAPTGASAGQAAGTEAAAAESSSGGLKGLFTPGGGKNKSRSKMRPMGRSPSRG